MKKRIFAIAFAASLALGMSMNVFAAEPAMTIFGQKPVRSIADSVDIGNYTYQTDSYVVYLEGREVLKSEDYVIEESGWEELWWPFNVSPWDVYGYEPGGTLELTDIMSMMRCASISLTKTEGSITYSQIYNFYYLPENLDYSFLGEGTKFIIKAKDMSNEKTASWAQNEIGWWIQYSDGSYLTDAWYQSPASGLWYYMGSDGYMLTDCWTPDGYYVNADGAWVQ